MHVLWTGLTSAHFSGKYQVSAVFRVDSGQSQEKKKETGVMHCLHPQTRGSEGAAAESKAGRLLRPADWSNPRLQRGSGQRAAAQSQHQTVGQTGEHNTAPIYLFIYFFLTLLMDFIDGYKWFWLLPGDEG